MGGEKSSGGMFSIDENVAAGIDLGAKAGGTYFGGPKGGEMASKGSKMLFGQDADSSSTVGKINKYADLAMSLSSGASSFGGSTGVADAGGLDKIKGSGTSLGASSGNVGEKLNSASVFGEKTSSIEGLGSVSDKFGSSGFQNLFGGGGQTENALNSAITSQKGIETSSKANDMMNTLKKGMELQQSITKAIGKTNDETMIMPNIIDPSNSQINNINPMIPITGMSQVIAAQLMNPAGQSRLAFRRFV